MKVEKKSEFTMVLVFIAFLGMLSILACSSDNNKDTDEDDDTVLGDELIAETFFNWREVSTLNLKANGLWSTCSQTPRTWRVPVHALS